MPHIIIATCTAWRQGNASLQALAQQLKAQLIAWQDIHAADIRGATLLPLAVWDYSAQPERYLAWLAELEAAQVRLINPRHIQEWNIRKNYLAELYTQGLPITPSLVLSGDHIHWANQIAASGWQNPVIKPLIGQSGKGVQRLAALKPNTATTNSATLTAADQSASLCQTLQNQYPSGALLQPFIHAPFGEVCLIYLQGKHFHTIHRRPAPQEWRANSAYGVEILPITPQTAWLTAAETLLSALPFQAAYARIDGLITAQGQFLCNEIEMIEPALYLPPERLAEAAALLLQ